MAECPVNISVVTVSLSLFELEREGIITRTPPAFPPAQAAYWHAVGMNPNRLAHFFQDTPVSISKVGQTDIAPAIKAFSEVGMRILRSAEAKLHIILADDHWNPDLREINQKALLEKEPWLLVCLNGSQPLIGPLFHPDSPQQPCWECLRKRMLLNDHSLQISSFFDPTTPSQSPHSQVTHPLIAQQAAAAAALELAKWVYQPAESDLNRHLIQLNPLQATRKLHPLTRLPQCQACGEPEKFRQAPQPIMIRPQARAETDGGYRTQPAEATLKAFEHQVSPLTGVVPHLHPYHAKEGLIYNYSSGRAIALQSKSMFWTNMHHRSGNGGKGKTEIQAKVGALCEAIERYSMMYFPDRYTVTGSLETIPRAIHPNTCMRFSDAQYARRKMVNGKATKFYSMIPAPFDAQAEMEWTPAYSLTEKEFKFLPTCFCYAQYPSEDEANLYSYPDSNGGAAGNTLEEAILQGFLELVERDAAAIWWYNRLKRPEIDLKNTSNPYIDQILPHYQSIGRALYVLDITTDFGIPTFVAISYRTQPNASSGILYAFGAHVEAGIALERAIVEINQLLPLAEKNEVKT
ncbi:MAG: TOMM precursor leader peptide-binding protein [Bacteroidota bacterium]